MRGRVVVLLRWPGAIAVHEDDGAKSDHLVVARRVRGHGVRPGYEHQSARSIIAQMGKMGIISHIHPRSEGKLATTLLPIEKLPRTRASDVKRDGWRAIVKAVGRKGSVLVTNHDQPEVVIVSIEIYSELLSDATKSKARNEEGLELLRERFDERMAVLTRVDAGDRLRAVMSKPATLRGKVKAGATY